MAMVRKDVEETSSSSSSSSAAATTSAGGAASVAGGAGGAAAEGLELATATHWPGIPPAAVLIAPHEARLAWREFMSGSALSVQQVGLRAHA
jgi:hypothetical protein